MTVITKRCVLLFSLFLFGFVYVIFQAKHFNYESSALFWFSSKESNSSSVKFQFATQSYKDLSEEVLVNSSALYSQAVQLLVLPTADKNESSSTLLPVSSNSSDLLSQSLVQPPPPMSCRRICTNKYQNVILLSKLNAAGWTDRIYMILATLQMAGYLCAKVWLPRPAFLLSVSHNRNEPLSKQITWNEFGEFQFVGNVEKRNRQDGSDFYKVVSSATTSPLVDWWTKEDINKIPNPNDVFEDPRFKDWFTVNTTDPHQIYDDWKQVEEFTWANDHNIDSRIGFIWHISADYYVWKRYLEQFIEDRRSSKAKPPSWLISDEVRQQTKNDNRNQSVTRNATSPYLFPNHSQWQIMQPSLKISVQLKSGSCEYATIRPPDHINEIHKKIRKFVTEQATQSVTNASFVVDSSISNFESNATQENKISFINGYFHIRRTDATKACNTTLESINQYLNCSFNTLTKSLWSSGIYKQKPLSIVVFLSSDENDQKYRQAVVRSVQRQSDRLRYATGAEARVYCIDLDNLIMQLIEEEIQEGRSPEWRRNNYNLYEAIYFLSNNRTMFQFQLEKRRSFSCPSCTNITEQILTSKQTGMKS